MSTPLLTVVIPHYNDLAGLDACLSALDAQTLGREAFTVVVGDNASPQGREAVQAVIRNRAALVIEPMKGAANARNAALPLVSTPYIAFTDSDCVPDPHWLETGLACLQSGRFDYYGGEMQVLAPEGRSMNGAEAFEYAFAFQNERYVRLGFSVTANLLVPTSIVTQVGGFVDGVSEDKDWCLRAGAAGFRIGYARGAIVRHPPRRNWQDLLVKWRRVHAEMAMLSRQKRGGQLDWLARTWAMPLSALAHTPKLLANPRLTAAEKLRAMGTLYRLRAWRFVDGHRQLLARRH